MNRAPHLNFMRRPTSIVRGLSELPSAVEPRNRTRWNSVKWLPPLSRTSARLLKQDQLLSGARSDDNRFRYRA